MASGGTNSVHLIIFSSLIYRFSISPPHHLTLPPNAAFPHPASSPYSYHTHRRVELWVYSLATATTRTGDPPSSLLSFSIFPRRNEISKQ